MSYNKDSGSLDEQKIASFLQEQLKRVEGASNAQIDELKQVAKLFKKNVPLSRRSYVLAQLLKGATAQSRWERGKGGDHQFKGDRSDRPSRANKDDRYDRLDHGERTERGERAAKGERRDAPPEKRSDERRERAPRISIDPSLADTIFVSVGKTRSVHPRDIVGLLVGVAGLEKSRIGDIRVLPSYSFVQLYSEDCQKAIDALDGYEYRGRKLGVSFSRKKGEDEASGDAGKVSDTEQTAPVVESAVAQSANVEPLVQQTDDTPEPSPVDAGGTGTPDAQVQPESPVQEADEGVETSDDGQVRSHFGDGAAY